MSDSLRKVRGQIFQLVGHFFQQDVKTTLMAWIAVRSAAKAV